MSGFISGLARASLAAALKQRARLTVLSSPETLALVAPNGAATLHKGAESMSENRDPSATNRAVDPSEENRMVDPSEIPNMVDPSEGGRADASEQGEPEALE